MNKKFGEVYSQSLKNISLSSDFEENLRVAFYERFLFQVHINREYIILRIELAITADVFAESGDGTCAEAVAFFVRFWNPLFIKSYVAVKGVAYHDHEFGLGKHLYLNSAFFFG